VGPAGVDECDRLCAVDLHAADGISPAMPKSPSTIRAAATIVANNSAVLV
jgi:hypothetical protein